MTIPWLALVSVLAGAELPGPQSLTAADTLLRVGLPRNVTLDRARLGVLSRDRAAATVLIRSAADDAWREGTSQDPHENFLGIGVRWAAPEYGLAHNSDLPFSVNEGVVWAGRGLSMRAQIGAEIRWGPVTATLVPQVWGAQNGDFQTFSFPENTPVRQRSPLASPFHYPPHSMDLPQRPRTDAFAEVRPGESSLAVRAQTAVFGAATERLRWGPAIRNPLLMSGDGEGFGHVFAQTLNPVSTPLGSVHAKWILGRLEESDQFDADPDNDIRSLSGAVVVLTPGFEPGLTVGVARVVFSPAESTADLLGAALDFVIPVGRVASIAGDTLLASGSDQLFSVFAHWVFPEAGFEAWGEWGRAEEPASFRDFLETPHHSRGYTMGLRHTRPFGAASHISVEAEHTSLEPSQTFRTKQHGEWYASRRVPQGYTHRGRVLGAGIGPSGSSQWLAVDWLASRWRIGLFGTRIRWENEALYTYPPEFRRADLTLLGGIRSSGDVGPFELEASYASSIRLNYLFQATRLGPDEYRGVDLRNRVLRFMARYVRR
ncbi:MAG: hypothetical protein OXU33_06270 [Gemmatimonadota bacterium]|nr:hypothetical protein [Gemmatimonadota bacterium]MDE3006147.1 hypothetical protein [Gemmatimonadota bacterium]MDE3013661.1 hypothetical protein [Gemmatimonadota bacterium]